MNARWISAFGVAVLALAAGIALFAGPADLSIRTVAVLGSMALAGVCWLLAGEGIALAGLAWYQWLGAGFLVFAVGLLAQGAAAVWSGGSGDLLYGASQFLLAVVFGFMGVDYARGGRHYDLSLFDPPEGGRSPEQ